MVVCMYVYNLQVVNNLNDGKANKFACLHQKQLKAATNYMITYLKKNNISEVLDLDI